MTQKNAHRFEALHQLYGSHTKAAEALGLHPTYYRRVRRLGKVSRQTDKLIDAIITNCTEVSDSKEKILLSDEKGGVVNA